MFPSSEGIPGRGDSPKAVYKEPENKTDRSQHEAGLDQVGPDDGLDSSYHRVTRGDQGHQKDAPEVVPQPYL